MQFIFISQSVSQSVSNKLLVNLNFVQDPTMNCLLNEKTRKDFPTAFATEIDGFVMAYFDYNEIMGVVNRQLVY